MICLPRSSNTLRRDQWSGCWETSGQFNLYLMLGSLEAEPEARVQMHVI